MALKDYHNTGTASDNQAFNSDRWNAMIFTTTFAYSIESVKLVLTKKIGESPGTITVSLRGVDGETEKPTGEDLTSGTINGNNLPDSGIMFQEIVFDIPISLDDATKYAICVRSQNGSGSTYYAYIRRATDAYANGHKTYSWDTGVTWYNTLTADYFFETYSVAVLPEKPINPAPIDTADNVTLDHETITWEDGGGATSYNVYYGENAGGLTLVSAGQVELSFTIFGINYGSPFDYVISRTWRIDAINADGVTPGNEWTFTTIVFDQLRISYVLIPGGSGAGPYDSPPGIEGTDWSWTGENNMLTVKRLVAVAKNAVFYEDV